VYEAAGCIGAAGVAGCRRRQHDDVTPREVGLRGGHWQTEGERVEPLRPALQKKNHGALMRV
jgi:hypothetical protein